MGGLNDKVASWPLHSSAHQLLQGYPYSLSEVGPKIIKVIGEIGMRPIPI